MPKIYASLIRKGLKTIEEVPTVIREEVKLLLVDVHN
ncbi:CD1375 family protein [Paenibacillus sp. 19GGS1-52]|nr:CD1375 family protein [Paenibacillus sp. 19GGS1-52]